MHKTSTHSFTKPAQIFSNFFGLFIRANKKLNITWHSDGHWQVWRGCTQRLHLFFGFPMAYLGDLNFWWFSFPYIAFFSKSCGFSCGGWFLFFSLRNFASLLCWFLKLLKSVKFQSFIVTNSLEHLTSSQQMRCYHRNTSWCTIFHVLWDLFWYIIIQTTVIIVMKLSIQREPV